MTEEKSETEVAERADEPGRARSQLSIHLGVEVDDTVHQDLYSSRKLREWSSHRRQLSARIKLGMNRRTRDLLVIVILANVACFAVE